VRFALLQEQDERREMTEKRAAAVAEVARLQAHGESLDRQLEETKAELHDVRQSSEVHQERANRSQAKLTAVNKEHAALVESAAKLEADVQQAAGDAASLRTQKDQSAEQVAELEDELRPLKQRKGALGSTVETHRERNVELNQQRQTTSELLVAAEASFTKEQERMVAATDACKALEEKVSKLEKQRQATTAAIEGLNTQVQSLTQTVGTMRSQAAKESEEMQGIESKNAGLETELKTLRAHSNMSATQQADALTQCSERCTELRAQEQQLLKESSATERDIAKLQATADAHAERIAALEADEAEHAARRRKLRANISDIKGNVRVFCRICPAQADAGSGSVTSGPSSTGVDDTVTMAPPGADETEGQSFTFGRVFKAESSDQQVFADVSDLVDRAVQGESVCIYSCGQSGSGKTAVLAGLQADEEKTVACRAVERLLQAADAARDEGWEYSITASLLVRPSPRAHPGFS